MPTPKFFDNSSLPLSFTSLIILKIAITSKAIPKSNTLNTPTSTSYASVIKGIIITIFPK